MKILVIAPHPDDEVLGCGGTISKFIKEGHRVLLCIVTKAYTPDWSETYIEEKKVEIDASNKILGIHETIFLNYPTVKLDTIPRKEFNDLICKTVGNVNPDIMFIPHKGDLNFDHEIVHNACLVAARPVKNSIKKILVYETLSETEWNPQGTPFIPNIFFNIEPFLDLKLSAMKAYKSEVRVFPHPRSLESIEALARKRGSDAGFNYAEAFMLIRERVF